MNVGKLPAGIAMTPDDKHLMVGIMGEDYDRRDRLARPQVDRLTS